MVGLEDIRVVIVEYFIKGPHGIIKALGIVEFYKFFIFVMEDEVFFGSRDGGDYAVISSERMAVAVYAIIHIKEFSMDKG